MIIAVVLLFSACMKDEELWMQTETGISDAGTGVFVVNEGNFMYGNGSLSYYDFETKEVENDLFFKVNELPLGDVPLSMTVHGGLGYVVVNNSGKIIVLDPETAAFKGKITGLTSPRHIHFLNDTKAYVTDLYARSVAIVNPGTFEVSGSVDVSNDESRFNRHSTDQMLQYGKYVFTNCWSYDNQILVIDSEKDVVVDSIRVLKQPTAMVLDRFNKLWVLTDGGFPGSPYGHEAPGLIRINAVTREVERIIRFSEGDHPADLKMNGTRDTLYMINRHLYRMPVFSGEDPQVFVESPYEGTNAGGFYGLGVDPFTSDIYLADAIDHVQRGVVYRYRSDGSPSDTFRVGISPVDFCFWAIQ